ncbi:hypothetical protein [Kordiimonas marina]|uniref:hypothetical protein n=1 Tax=Kordiimonas marina TaxID=2872312 RepID=UPI001FF54C72|nr:hypothetical protein [Kordiimonas marina]MCJ9427857.1 hypothetical protein [Kordiimonas marina]
MTKLAKLHLRLGGIYALFGMALGIHMAAKADYTLAPVHAHVNLLGWVSVMIYGLVYTVFKDRPVTMLMKLHAVLAHVGLWIITVGLFIFLQGSGSDVPAIIGSLLTILSMAVFVVILFGLTAEPKEA